jgi:hypothetical protein
MDAGTAGRPGRGRQGIDGGRVARLEDARATFEKDFILRQVHQLAQWVARIVLRARAEDQYASGLEEVRATMEGGLGIDYEMLGRIDSQPPAR